MRCGVLLACLRAAAEDDIEDDILHQLVLRLSKKLSSSESDGTCALCPVRAAATALCCAMISFHKFTRHNIILLL